MCKIQNLDLKEHLRRFAFGLVGSFIGKLPSHHLLIPFASSIITLNMPTNFSVHHTTKQSTLARMNKI